MNRHYDKYLTTKYQPLYVDRRADPRETLMCWGFEINDGWFHIINGLSALLCAKWMNKQREYLRLSTDPDTPAAKLEQARLHAQAEFDATPKAVQVKEKYGTLRFYVDGATDEQYGMIRMAEVMSGRTCEICGKPGKLYTSGWWTTRCLEHRR